MSKYIVAQNLNGHASVLEQRDDGETWKPFADARSLPAAKRIVNALNKLEEAV